MRLYTGRLTAYRQHAHRMAAALHTPECEARVPEWERRRVLWAYWGHPDPGPRPPACDGCVSDADRAMWARLAAEADDYVEGLG